MFKWHHWLTFAVVLFIGYWAGEKMPGKLKGIPVIGPYT